MLARTGTPAWVNTTGSAAGEHQPTNSDSLLWESELPIVSSWVQYFFMNSTLSELRITINRISLANPRTALFFMSFLPSSDVCLVRAMMESPMVTTATTRPAESHPVQVLDRGENGLGLHVEPVDGHGDVVADDV